MVIKKIKWLIDGNACQPKRELREFYRHGVYINSINASFYDAPPPVRYLSFFLRKPDVNRDEPAAFDLLFRASMLAACDNALGLSACGRMVDDVFSEIFSRSH